MFSPTLRFLLLSLSLGSLSSPVLGAIGPTADVTISNAQVSPDGFTRLGTVINGKIDTTIITAQKGDTLRLNLVNALSNSALHQTTSIHWHGFLQKGTNWADGPAFINQCPISKGHSFLYQFKAESAGTYWYHSHLSTQYCDGARGVIVVYDSQDSYVSLYDVDDDNTVITLSDWYHTLSPNADMPNPKPDSILINGRGRYKDGPATPLTVITVEKGKRYRFRLVNTGCLANYIFQIDGHDFTVIEADSVNHQPLLVDSIQIYTGQRYSFILNANQAVKNYWIRAKPDRADEKNTKDGFNSAILRYVGAPTSNPTTDEDDSENPLREERLKPTVPVPVPGTPVRGGVNQAINLAISQSSGEFFVNGVSFHSPSVPVLLQVLSGAMTAQQLIPAGSIYVLNQGNSVELTIPGAGSGGPHPIHLHGHAFQVIRSAGSNTYNYIDPPIRDVVNSGNGGDNVTIRFAVDNPGPWFLHCHIDWHLEVGLAVVFAENPPATAAANPVPAAWSDLCPIYAAQAPGDL